MPESGILEDEVAIVTGAGRNVGEEIANAFAEEGAKIGVVDIDEKRATSTAEDLRDNGYPATAEVTDISDEEQVIEMVGSVEDEFGSIDILINSAAITDRGHLLDLSVDDFKQVMDVNLLGTFLCTREAAKSMRASDGGRILNFGSTSAHSGRVDAAAYATSKSGILNFTRSAAIALAPYDIRVNTLSPTRVGSPVGSGDDRTVEPDSDILVGRWGKPEDMAHAALFFVDPRSEFVNGTELLVDGGSSATFPGFDPEKSASPSGE